MKRPALSKLVVFWKKSYRDGSNVFYSWDSEQSLIHSEPDEGISRLVNYLLRQKLKGQYYRAQLYDNQNNELLFTFDEEGNVI